MIIHKGGYESRPTDLFKLFAGLEENQSLRTLIISVCIQMHKYNTVILTFISPSSQGAKDMKSLKKALAKNNTLKVLKIEDLANGEDVEEEIFEELGKALGVSTSLEEFSFPVLKLDQPSWFYTWTI